MKKIILKKEVSNIHIDEITVNNLIIAKRDSKTIGFIVWHIGSGEWICKYTDGEYSWDGKNRLADLLTHTSGLEGCEFYVFDE